MSNWPAQLLLDMLGVAQAKLAVEQQSLHITNVPYLYILPGVSIILAMFKDMTLQVDSLSMYSNDWAVQLDARRCGYQAPEKMA